MRWLAILLLAFASQVSAQEELSAFHGVWAGKVGTYPVVMCLVDAGEGNTRGAYYYLSQLRPIALKSSNGQDGWDEHQNYEPTGAQWRKIVRKGDIFSGTWSQGKRSLQIALNRQPWNAGELDDPCMSDAFLGQRSGGGNIWESPVSVDGWDMIQMIFEKPPQLEDVEVATFRLELARPGDAAVNALLVKGFPDGTSRSEMMQCMGQAISSNGTDGYYANAVEPTLVTPRWLGAIESYEAGCGGAHPGQGYRYRTFDRDSGEEIDLLSWLGPGMVEYVASDTPETAYHKVLPALRELILAEGPDSDTDEPYQPECAEYAQEEEFWNAGLSREGMQFVPSVPHALGPCAATFTVPWTQLEPSLNAEGHDGLRALRLDGPPS